jgi:hypothetical protein
VPDFGRMFLILKYADITQNTYVQSWMVTEIMAREKCGLLAGPRTVSVGWQVLSKFVLSCDVRWQLILNHKLHMFPSGYDGLRNQPCYVSACHSCVLYSAWNSKDNSHMVCKFSVTVQIWM